MVDEAIEERIGWPFVAEGASPFVQVQVGVDDPRAPFVASAV